jgi:hypothetical protein
MKTISQKILSILFRMDSADFRHFMAKIWFFLSFSVSASKFQKTLIIINTGISENPNQFQREFDSNVAIRTFGTFLASSLPRQKTNLYKLFPLSLRSGERVRERG